MGTKPWSGKSEFKRIFIIISRNMDLLDILNEINPELLAESGYEYVIRKGKKIKRKKRRKGFKVVGGKYKKISAREKMKRKLGARKGAKKRKAKKSQMKRKRKISMRKRKSMGLK